MSTPSSASRLKPVEAGPKARCEHCGTPLNDLAIDHRFCCAGCAYVYRMIHDTGHERYYDLKDRRIQPVGSDILQGREFDWLEPVSQRTESETDGATAEAVFRLRGLSCIGCVWLIEKLFTRHPGSVRAESSVQHGEIKLVWEKGRCDLPAFARQLQQFGYLLEPRKAGDERRSETRGLVTRIGVCGAFAMNATMFTLPSYLGMDMGDDFALMFQLLTVLFSTLSLLVGGSVFISRAWEAARRGVLHIDLPIAIGLSAAYLGSLIGLVIEQASFLYFDFVALFIFLMLIGRWVQETALERNRHQLARYTQGFDTYRRRLGDSNEYEPVSIENLQAGDVLEIPAGGVVPCESRLASRQAELSLEWINGEPEPLLCHAEQPVPAGARILSVEGGQVVLEQSWEESLLRRLTAIQTGVDRSPRLEAVLRTYIAVVIAASLASVLVWSVLLAAPLTGFQAALSLLVVSCPCALGVAYPLANEWSTTHLRDHGVFLRNALILQILPRIRSLLFDKTGTLTLEIPQLYETAAVAALDQRQRQALYLLVRDSHHPVGRSLREALFALPEFHPPPSPEAAPVVHETVGMGVQIDWDGALWSLGRAGWRVYQEPSVVPGWDAEFARDGQTIARFSFSESLRSGAKSGIRFLRTQCDVFILSGDRREKVLQLARDLGLPEASALGGQSPDDKADWVRHHAGRPSLFVGDGANDSLAFDEADCRGAPIVHCGPLQEKADFLFFGRGIEPIVALFQLARKRRRAVQRVFAFAVAYNVVAGILCLAAYMTPLLAAILMPLSSVATIAIVASHFRHDAAPHRSARHPE